jgi:outer membrane immunogenic protein
MKKFLLASAALIAFGLPASAADLAVKAPMYKAPPPIRVFSWTGCYVGGNIGGIWSSKEWTDRDPLFGNPAFVGTNWGTHNASGWLGGLQAGCDYQFAGGWVIGIAGDYDWTNANSSSAVAFPFLAPGFSTRSNINNLASVTGRLGYAWDRFLGYVKGGGAWERDDYTVLFNGVGLASASATRSGWTVGIGGEYAFTDWVSVFAEYDYYSFGTRSSALVCGPVNCFGAVNVGNWDIKDTKSVFKVGLNFRFGSVGKGPVVARY